MNPKDVDDAKARIEAILKTHKGARAGIAFGVDLFSAFVQRKWIESQTFTALGTSAFPIEVPAYERSHFAWPTWDLEPHDFRVGPDV